MFLEAASLLHFFCIVCIAVLEEISSCIITVVYSLCVDLICGVISGVFAVTLLLHIPHNPLMLQKSTFNMGQGVAVKRFFFV